MPCARRCRRDRRSRRRPDRCPARASRRSSSAARCARRTRPCGRRRRPGCRRTGACGPPCSCGSGRTRGAPRRSRCRPARSRSRSTPIAMTSPANSCPTTIGTGIVRCAHASQARMCRSVPQMPVRSTRISTSLMPTSGSGASTSQSPGRASDFASAFTPPCSPRRSPSGLPSAVAGPGVRPELPTRTLGSRA